MAVHQAAMVGVKRNPYLSAAAMNSDSVAAVAAVAAMAVGELSGGSMKKCRARFGLEHQNLWCKPCRYASYNFHRIVFCSAPLTIL